MNPFNASARVQAFGEQACRTGGCATVASALAVLAFSGEWPVSAYGAGLDKSGV